MNNQDINVEELKIKLDQKEDILVIDVREPWEFEEFNIGAKLIPLGDLQSKVDDLDDYMDKEVIVHCKSGARSAAAKEFLIRRGFTNVRNLTGGMLAWQERF
jgi:rhodanese-related sulfurtransferase